MTRLRGRAPRGECPHAKAPHSHWKTTTMISCPRLDGSTKRMTIGRCSSWGCQANFLVVANEEEVNGNEMMLDAFGKRSGHGAPVGSAAPVACQRSVRRGWSHPLLWRRSASCALKMLFRRPARIAAGGSAAIILRDMCAQADGTLLTTISDRVGDHFAGASAERDPEPTLLGFLLHEAPKFIEFEHVARFAGQERVLEGGRALTFSPTQTIKVW